VAIIDRGFGDLSPKEFHDIAKLRVDVFVVEQQCAYPELDGSDVLDSTRHIWLSDRRGIAAYLRVLRDAEATTVGRVVTRADARSEGRAGALIEYVLAGTSGPWTLEAQAHLAGWYRRFGFEVVGDEYLWDGILHVPMCREP